MNASTLPPDSTRVSQASLSAIARNGDLLMLATLIGQAVAALAIGHHFGSLGLAAGCGALLVLLGVGAFSVGRGSLLAQVVLTVCNVSLVALHIQLGRGTIEFHFGVFVLLGLVLVYRDWRPLVLTAGLFAVHHVAFDRLQAMNIGVYCTPEADLLKTMMHAIYVVAQTAIEIYLAVGLRRAAIEEGGLARVAAQWPQGGRAAQVAG